MRKILCKILLLVIILFLIGCEEKKEKTINLKSELAKTLLVLDNALIDRQITDKTNDDLVPVEIKSGKTVSQDYFKGINYWQKLSGKNGGYVVYGGEQRQTRSFTTVLPWRQCLQVF